MAFSTAAVRQASDVHGNQKVTVTDITADASYAAGGAPVTAAALGLAFVQSCLSANIVTAAATGNAIDAVGLPQTDGSVKLKLNAAAAEVANGAGTGLVVRLVAAGY